MRKDRPEQSSEQMGQKKIYAVRALRDTIASEILPILPSNMPSLAVIEAPNETGFDYGVNLSAVAKQFGMSPNEVASPLIRKAEAEHVGLFEEVASSGPFLNFKVDMSKFGTLTLNQIFEMGTNYGKENDGKGRKVVIDMSSPNIAKRMSYGHLRSTIIGDALANLYRAQGYEVIRDNHLGDWGTQFGNMIVAIKKWGNEQELLASQDPIGGLQDLYVKFTAMADEEKKVLWEEAKEKATKEGNEAIPGLTEAVESVSQEIMKRKNIPQEQLDMTKVLEDALDRVVESSLEKEGRAWFLKLEQGDPEARRLWKLCVDLSIKEFDQMYEMLGVGFEVTLGESFYENQLQNVANIVRKSKAGKISEGALVIDMRDKGLGVAIVQKSDGASLYLTRDLACAIYRQNEMGADKAIYVVGDDQKQYFRQLFEALRRLDYKIGENAEHVYFGMVSLPEGKMSTRKGRVILLKDVIAEGLKRADEVLQAKNPELSKNEALRKTIVRQIAIGALKWNDLSQDAKRPIVFDWDKALNFQGNSAPYVQYTAVRANSILEAFGKTIQAQPSEIFSKDVYQETSERTLIRQLAEYPNVLKEATDTNNPAKIAAYVYELAKRFNSFYTRTSVLKAENQEFLSSRVRLVAATSQVITNALKILGIEVPQKM